MKLASVLIIASILMTVSCARQPVPHEEIPRYHAGDARSLMRKLEYLGSRLHSIKAKGRIKATVEGQANPSIRFEMAWKQGPERVGLRIFGYAPLGMSVFDCLVTEEELFLLVPKHKQVYYLRKRSDTAARDMGTLFRLVLNPWLAGGMPGAKGRLVTDTARPERQRLLVEFPLRGQIVRAFFSPQGPFPERIELPGGTVSYSGLYDGSSEIPYPSRVFLDLNDYHSEVRIEFAKLDTNVSLSGKLFDQESFFHFPFAPLRFLKEGGRS